MSTPTITARRPGTDLGAAGAELTVDLDAVAANCRLFADRAAGELMAVVKADGFGHGAVAVARTALANGASWVGVTALTEGLVLRAAGVRAPLLSWLNPLGADFGAAVQAGIDLAVPSIAHLDAVVGSVACASGPARPARIHLHLDTGLARDGAGPDEWPALCRAARLAEQQELVQVVGVMGHLACSDEPGHPANAAGRASFDRGLRIARASGLTPVHRHLAATAATLADPLAHHTMVRVGAGLVGIDPSGSTALHPTMTLTAPVTTLRRVPAGTGVGYGHTWVAPRPTTLALLPVGYADGLPRVASGRAQVLLAGRRCPVVGRISMDQVVVDVGPDHPVSLGDTATVLSNGADGAPTATEWAAWSSTLEHEVVTGLGSAPARVRRDTTPTTISRSTR